MNVEPAPSLIEHSLVNTQGDRVRLLNIGARIRSIRLQLRAGSRELALGYPAPEAYLRDTQYMGCTIGWFCNRIGRARFILDGRAYHLTANDGAHHLHGGTAGFDTRFWQIHALKSGVNSYYPHGPTSGTDS